MEIRQFKIALHVFGLFLLCAIQSSDVTARRPCTCDVGRAKFGDCSNKEFTWGNHHDDDIGLYRDCLPPVPENSVKCFRWRVARQCGEDNIGVRCGLKHRIALDATLEPTHQNQSVLFRSPGFYRRNKSEPKGAYYNRNFCIFNISLDCQGNIVEMIPLENTNTLSDSDTCQDYLSFHTHSSSHPQFKLCGKKIMDRARYQLMAVSTFYGILWTNNNQNERGRFEIQARCKVDLQVNSTTVEATITTSL